MLSTTRRKLIFWVPLGIFLVFALNYFTPGRCAVRTVQRTLNAFESNEMDVFTKYISPDYKDSAGFRREELLELADKTRNTLQECSIYRRHDEKGSSFEEGTRSARLLFKVSLNGVWRKEMLGTAVAPDLSFIPKVDVVFVLKRASWLPWDWSIISVETNHDACLRRHLRKLASVPNCL